jgi:hypothetical protein
VLPVKNGGPGVALNVWATLEWPATGQNIRTVPTSLAPGDSDTLRIDWRNEPITDWDNVKGVIVYEDIAHVIWETSFHVTAPAGQRRSVYVGKTRPQVQPLA